MYEVDTDDFLEHYGKKGMKWGVRKAAPEGSAKAARQQLRKASRDKFTGYHKVNKADGTKGRVGVGRTAASVLLSTNTFGASTGFQIARSAGATKGGSVAVGLLGGPLGGLAYREIKIRNDARLLADD